ncbi:DUF4878 domain-containing protein [Gordonia sp. TBRC 11910]|uniref:DUF4878 domain-containing protein n=1 Tax=Gordonia asplenii TaxID=2725283 RepID=A0A848KPY9_9ACTN|nr:DUF4878 domain-containing protein [Gordonia asplenii]NMO00089.1 DUF4878 domain-containing protein [Gordonia asplenii]
MNLRKTAAAAAIVGAAVFGVAACSNGEVASNTTGTTPSVVSDSPLENAAVDLSVSDAQTALRKAIDPKTTAAELDAVVDTDSAATKTALQAFAKGASMGGYTPDVFTVKSVKGDGKDKAVATVSVASPHAPQPVDIKLSYVDVDGTWKLSADAVSQLTSLAGDHTGH